MEQPFNPYAEWLETPGGARPQNYYELLGLKPFEGDRDAIVQAADGLRNRIRRIRPGAHLREWQSLLDEIGAGRQCLLDPASKAAYDAQLRNPASGVPAAQPIVATPPVRAIPPSPAAFPARPSPQVPQAGPPAYPWNSPAMSTYGQQPQQPYQDTQPAAGYPYPSAAAGTPDDVAAAFSPEMYAPAPRARRKKPGKSAGRRAVEVLLLIGCLALAAAFVFVLYIGYTGSTGEALMADREGQATAAENEGSAGAEKQEKQEKQRSEAYEPEWKRAARAARDDRRQPVPNGGRERSAEGPKPPLQLAQAQAPAKPAAPAKPEPPPDPAKQAELKKSLQAVRVAMAQRNAADAQQKLTEAKANAKTHDEQTQVTRYENLYNYLLEFWRGFRRRLAALRPTEELDLGSTRIIVVEVSEDRLSFKTEGRIFRYRLETMPGKVVTSLADVWMGKDSQSKVILGAFLAVEGNVERAQRLWNEAAQAGENVSELLPPVAEIAVTGIQPGGGNAADAERFRKAMAALKDRADTARGSSHYRELAKQGVALAEEALDAGCVAEGLILSQMSGELARKAQSPALARQAAAIERKIEALQKQEK